MNAPSSGRCEPEQDSILEIVSNYRQIIRQINHKSAQVKLQADDPALITIDGCLHDLDYIFSHNDAEITECRMAIDCLLSDLSAQGHSIDSIIKKVETELNHRRD